MERAWREKNGAILPTVVNHSCGIIVSSQPRRRRSLSRVACHLTPQHPPTPRLPHALLCFLFCFLKFFLQHLLVEQHRFKDALLILDYLRASFPNSSYVLSQTAVAQYHARSELTEWRGVSCVYSACARRLKSLPRGTRNMFTSVGTAKFGYDVVPGMSK